MMAPLALNEFKGTVLQIEKVLTNDRLQKYLEKYASKVS